VVKGLRTAEQLSDMIIAALGVGEVSISVRKDHAYGWQPTVISSPGDTIGYQGRAEEIANRLRVQFDLREWGLLRAPMTNKRPPEGGLPLLTASVKDAVLVEQPAVNNRPLVSYLCLELQKGRSRVLQFKKEFQRFSASRFVRCDGLSSYPFIPLFD
jgi:hypothetical protein